MFNPFLKTFQVQSKLFVRCSKLTALGTMCVKQIFLYLIHILFLPGFVIINGLKTFHVFSIKIFTGSWLLYRNVDFFSINKANIALQEFWRKSVESS